MILYPSLRPAHKQGITTFLTLTAECQMNFVSYPFSVLLF